MATASPEPSDSVNPSVSQDELLRFLSTPFNAVFTLTQDETKFFMPSVMRHVPVDVISEDSPYYDPEWTSVTDFLEGEAHEEKEKLKYKELMDLHPDNKVYRERHKNHQDNVSKYRKIREIFGPGSNYHPNQLVAKCHLPVGGLCEKEIMYRLACKISELSVLHEKNDLVMDPWDFIRWRIASKIQEHLSHPGGRGHNFIKSVIQKLWDLDDGHTKNIYADPLMREAAIRSARLSNRPNLYKTTHTGRKSSATGIPREPKKSTTGRKRGRPKGSTSKKPSPEESREARRRERKRNRESIPAMYRDSVYPTYTGVNNWRANKLAQNQGK
ncbi:hypothetical protein CP533_3968 [Ophiocordyceps camponoti-saundersi (nom. inval.)]|nr:hypothetical protein CP533_3968 [Ophiocordyceps camponoti-saundersi (nom. inval.)]